MYSGRQAEEAEQRGQFILDLCLIRKPEESLSKGWQ